MGQERRRTFVMADVKPGGSGRELDLGFGCGGALSSTTHLGGGGGAGFTLSDIVDDVEYFWCD
jgi:hypothetical protein